MLISKNYQEFGNYWSDPEEDMLKFRNTFSNGGLNLLLGRRPSSFRRIEPTSLVTFVTEKCRSNVQNANRPLYMRTTLEVTV